MIKLSSDPAALALGGSELVAFFALGPVWFSVARFPIGAFEHQLLCFGGAHVRLSACVF